MVAALKVLLRTECSPLEAGVEYFVPDNSLLMPLLTQLEGLQALWAAVDRSELISVTFWNALLVHDTHPCFALPDSPKQTWLFYQDRCEIIYTQVKTLPETAVVDYDRCKA